MLTRLDNLAERRINFAFETTLATLSYARRIKELQSAGYRFQLVYLWLNSPELAIERFRERVRLGGHHIPEETVRRRFGRGRKNFVNIYQPLSDAWHIYDASGPRPNLIAFGDKIIGDVVLDNISWKMIDA